MQILRRSRGIGCQNEFSKSQRITASIVPGCGRCCCGAERRDRGPRCEVRERGRSTRHVNKAGRAGNQAEGSDWLKPVCHVGVFGWGSTLSRRLRRGRSPPPCPHSQDMWYMLQDRYVLPELSSIKYLVPGVGHTTDSTCVFERWHGLVPLHTRA